MTRTPDARGQAASLFIELRRRRASPPESWASAVEEIARADGSDPDDATMIRFALTAVAFTPRHEHLRDVVSILCGALHGSAALAHAAEMALFNLRQSMLDWRWGETDPTPLTLAKTSMDSETIYCACRILAKQRIPGLARELGPRLPAVGPYARRGIYLAVASSEEHEALPILRAGVRDPDQATRLELFEVLARRWLTFGSTISSPSPGLLDVSGLGEAARSELRAFADRYEVELIIHEPGSSSAL